KFHLGVYWLAAAPFFMWAAPALGGAVFGESVAAAIVASQSDVLVFTALLWMAQTGIQTGIAAYHGQPFFEALADNRIVHAVGAAENAAIGFAVPIPATLVGGGVMVGAVRVFGASEKVALALGRAGVTYTEYGIALGFLGVLGVGTIGEAKEAYELL